MTQHGQVSKAASCLQSMHDVQPHARIMSLLLCNICDHLFGLLWGVRGSVVHPPGEFCSKGYPVQWTRCKLSGQWRQLLEQKLWRKLKMQAHIPLSRFR